MAQNPNLAALSAAGVSVWLDDLSRDRLRSGNLQQLIDTRSIVGVTTNPSIFQAALSKGTAYDAQVAELAERGADVDAVIRTATTDDVREACDVLRPQWNNSNGVDGRVSIEVDPRLAHDTDKTVLQAIELWKIVDRPNLLIKIPATKAGLPAITAVIAEGISVNVTLIFSVERHREVMDAYLAGLEAARAAGHDLNNIHSVASFFVSRVDTEIDARLEKIGTKEALELRGKAALPLLFDLAPARDLDQVEDLADHGRGLAVAAGRPEGRKQEVGRRGDERSASDPAQDECRQDAALRIDDEVETPSGQGPPEQFAPVSADAGLLNDLVDLSVDQRRQRAGEGGLALAGEPGDPRLGVRRPQCAHEGQFHQRIADEIEADINQNRVVGPHRRSVYHGALPSSQHGPSARHRKSAIGKPRIEP